MERHGVETGVWSEKKVPDKIGGYEVPASQVVLGTLAEAVAAFKPDLVHAHWLGVGMRSARVLDTLDVPLTVRGHSLEFSPDLARRVASRPSVSCVWLYPHFVDLVGSVKVAPLTCCYDERRFYPSVHSIPRSVIRMGPARPGKGIDEFLEIARRCPSVPFTLVIASRDQEPLAVDLSHPANVMVLFNLQYDEMARVTREASICLRGHDPNSHSYGMPVSIAESMACGAHVIARKDPAAESYIGDAGTLYDSVDGAVNAIQKALAWPEEIWWQARERSVARAQRFRSDVVLPEILAEWRRITGVS